MSRDEDTKTGELESEKEAEKPVENMLPQEHDTPLFLRDSPEGKKGNAQDEKDRVEE